MIWSESKDSSSHLSLKKIHLPKMKKPPLQKMRGQSSKRLTASPLMLSSSQCPNPLLWGRIGVGGHGGGAPPPMIGGLHSLHSTPDHWRAPLTPSSQEVLLLCFGVKVLSSVVMSNKRAVFIESSRVVCVYLHTEAERAEKLLSLSGLGGGTALERMAHMLSFLGPDDGGFLFAHIFLRQLPAAMRAGLANSPLPGTKDYRSLAEDADRIQVLKYLSIYFYCHCQRTMKLRSPAQY
ncbi:uncharacterized protein LOC120718144 [Simochromis diagramma]|uniref:uncharacterized protein LOC120718144 n=1 Tax=Simochromis diagramma TaxID=43689 RepID=UPI001A7E7E5E|nr:uncharacterized protein LOC120718144 [Simochromis diagramma]